MMKFERIRRDELEFDEVNFMEEMKRITYRAIDILDDGFNNNTYTDSELDLNDVMPEEVYNELFNAGIDKMIEALEMLKYKD